MRTPRPSPGFFTFVPVCLLVFAAALPVRAQPKAAAKPTVPAKPAASVQHDAIKAAATDLYDRGMKAMDEQRWDDCRASFLAAWNIDRYYQIAGNLAACEAKLGRYVDAAEHITFSLHEMPTTAPAERRALAEKLLAEVRAKVAEITIGSSKTGAEIFLDGRSLGRSPLASAVFVEPGEHKLEAKLDGAAAQTSVTATGGGTHEAMLKFEEPKKEQLSERSMAPAYVLGGVGIASLLTGGVLIGVAESTHAELKADAPRGENGQLLCRRTPGGAATTAECDAWRAKSATASAEANAALGLFIGGGVAVAGAAAYWLWAAKTPPSSARSWTVVPVVGADAGGVVWTGKF